MHQSLPTFSKMRVMLVLGGRGRAPLHLQNYPLQSDHVCGCFWPQNPKQSLQSDWWQHLYTQRKRSTSHQLEGTGGPCRTLLLQTKQHWQSHIPKREATKGNKWAEVRSDIIHIAWNLSAFEEKRWSGWKEDPGCRTRSQTQLLPKHPHSPSQ